MSKRTFFLIGILLGIIIGAWVAYFGNNLRWQTEAWDHHAAVWTRASRSNVVKWQWLDDYFAEEQRKHVTPTPNPSWKL